MADLKGDIGAGPLVPETFEDFFRRLYPQLVRIAFRVLDRTDAAQDVAQDALLAAYGRYPDGLSNPAAWVRSATVHQALNQVRATRRRARREIEGAPSTLAAEPSAEESAVQADERRRVRDALGRLGRDKAAVLVLRHSGLSYLEVAEAMGISPTSVGTTLRRAEEQFRKEVER